MHLNIASVLWDVLSLQLSPYYWARLLYVNVFPQSPIVPPCNLVCIRIYSTPNKYQYYSDTQLYQCLCS